MLDDERLLSLRPLLDEPPTIKTWRALTEQLEAWEDEDELEERLLPELEPALERWDDRLRRAHASWVARLLEGEYVPHLKIVRELDLRSMGLDVEDAELLAESAELSGLTRLLLPYNGMQDDGTICLANTSILSNLELLDLAGNSVGTEGVLAIARSAHLGKLKHLDLTGNWVGDEAAIALASSAHLTQLEALVLRGNPVRAEGARALATSSILPESIREHWRDFET